MGSRPDQPKIYSLQKMRQLFAGESDPSNSELLELCAHPDIAGLLLDKLSRSDIDQADVLQVLETLFDALYTHIPIKSDFVLRWFKLMLSTTLLTATSHGTTQSQESVTTQAILISLAILGLARSTPIDEHLLSSEVYLASADVLIALHELVLSLSVKSECSLISLAWGTYLHQLDRSVGDGWHAPAEYQKFINKALPEASQPFRYLIESAIARNFYLDLQFCARNLPGNTKDRERLILFELFRDTQEYTTYSESTASLIRSLVTSRALALAAWHDGTLLQLLSWARQQFPLRALPLLQLLCAASHATAETLDYLDRFDTYTQYLPRGFTSFTITDTQTNGTLVELSKPLELFRNIDGSGIMLTAGTRGLLNVVDSQQAAMWLHTYCPLEYLYSVLETLSAGHLTQYNCEVIKSILHIFGHLLKAESAELFQSLSHAGLADLQALLLHLAERGLANNQPDLVVDTLETQCTMLRDPLAASWRSITQLRLFDLDNQSATFVERIRACQSDAKVKLHMALCNLFNVIADNMVSTLLTSSADVVTSQAKFLLCFCQSLCDAHKDLFNWTTELLKLYDVCTAINDTFARILATYSTAQLAQPSRLNKLENLFLPTVLQIRRYLSRVDDFDTSPRAFAMALALSTKEQISDTTHLQLARSVFHLYSVLLDSASRSEREACISLRRALASHIDNYIDILPMQHTPRLEFFELLTSIYTDHTGSLPSMIAKLGSRKEALRKNLDSLLRAPFELSQLEFVALWSWVDCLLQPVQEGIALYLLTDAKDGVASVLDNLINYLTKIDPSAVDIYGLSTVLRVANSIMIWPMLAERFFSTQSLSKSLATLAKQWILAKDDRTETQMKEMAPHRLQCAGLIFQLLSRDVMRTGEDQFDYGDYVQTLPGNVFSMGQCRRTLHVNLAKNLSTQYPGFSLQDLERPEAVVRSRYGDEFRYRTDLAAKMMTNPSFLQEIKYANKDLSLISARVCCCRGLKSLLEAFLTRPVTSAPIWLKMHEITTQSLLSTDNDVDNPDVRQWVFECQTLLLTVVQAMATSSIVSAKIDEYATLLTAMADHSAWLSESLDLGRQLSFHKALCSFLAALVPLNLPGVPPSSIAKSLCSLFESACCRSATKALARMTADAGLYVCIDTLAVLVGIIQTLCDRYTVPVALLALDLSHSQVLRICLDIMSTSACSEGYVVSITSCTQYVLSLTELTGTLNELARLDAFRVLRGMPCLASCRQEDLHSQLLSAVVRHLWVRGILPIVLELSTILPADHEMFLQAYSVQINRTLGMWSEPLQSITQLHIDELVYTVMLLDLRDNRSASSVRDIIDWKSPLTTMLSHYLSHPISSEGLMSRTSSDIEIVDMRNSLQQLKSVLEAI